MASYGYTFNSGDSVTPTRLNAARTVSDIVNADISATAAIAGTKIAPNFGSQDVVTTGRIGAGTASPTVPLDVRGSTSSARIISTTSTNHAVVGVGTETNQLRVGMEGSSGGTLLFGTAAYSGVIGTDTAQPLALGTNATERLRIDANGNVGIGTSSPQRQVETFVSGGGNAFQARSSTVTTDFGITSANDAALLYTRTSHPLVFGTNNIERLRIDASGNVGIGTSSPSERLTVVGANSRAFEAGGSNASIRLAASEGGWLNAFRFLANNGTELGGMIAGGSSQAINYIGFNVDGSERMRIDSSGNVGIGAASGGAPLLISKASEPSQGTIHIRPPSGSNASITFTENTVADRGSIGFAAGSGTLEIKTGGHLTSGTTRMVINASGNVGIGTTSPAYLLDASGTVNTSDAYRVDGTQVVSNRRTGWAAPTGTATRTAFATSTVTTAQLAERVKALIDDLTTHGLIGS